MVADVVANLRRKGISLWSNNGELHYKAPKGVITKQDMECIRYSRIELLDLLTREGSSAVLKPQTVLRPPIGHIPLTYSQLMHWNEHHANGRRHLRQIASATRLRGRLNVDALRSSTQEMVRRHEALRTRIVVTNGRPVQEVVESAVVEFEVEDLRSLAGHLREAEVQRIIERFICKPIDVLADSLFGVKLIRLDEQEHILILTLEHIISDGYSLNVLLHDLLAAYARALTGRTVASLPSPIQLSAYALRQRETEASWRQHSDVYWKERLEGRQRTRLPRDSVDPRTPIRRGWLGIPVRIEPELKQALDQWCRTNRTTPAMGLFTAYAALLLRWCNVSEAVVRYQTDGRTRPALERTIGYLAFPVYLLVELHQGDSFVALTRRITEEFCRAYEHTDYCYSDAQLPRPDITRCAGFNWQRSGGAIELPALTDSADALECSSVRFVHPMMRKLELDAEPALALFDCGMEVVGDLYFPLKHFAVDSMERFVRNLRLFLGALVRQPEEDVMDLRLI